MCFKLKCTREEWNKLSITIEVRRAMLNSYACVKRKVQKEGHSKRVEKDNIMKNLLKKEKKKRKKILLMLRN